MPAPSDIQAKLKSGCFTDQDVQALLHWQTALPSEQKDCALMKECVLFLYPDKENITEDQKAVLWRRIEQRMTGAHAVSSPAKGRLRLPVNRRLVFVLAAILAVLLAAGALAWAIQRGVFNFIYDFGLPASGTKVQKGASALLQSNLAHISLAHVDVDVREAAYNGHDLMVVYSITERGRKTFVTDDEVYRGTLEAAMEDGIYVCDWIEVDGKKSFFDRTWAARGEKPGELLCYLQTNLASSPYYANGDPMDVGDLITVGLPLMPINPSDVRASRVPEGLAFTLDTTQAQSAVRRALRYSTQIHGVPITIEIADFSPVSGAIRLLFMGDERAAELAGAYAYACLYDADGNQAGVTQMVYYADRKADGYRTELVVFPPEVWPEKMMLALPDKEGKADMETAIAINME